MSKSIQLHGAVAAGRVAIVDDQDYERVSQCRWHVVEYRRAPGRRLDGPYAYTSTGRYPGPKLSMHGLITGWPMTDHVDHDGLNNQRSNLRPATKALNNHNQRPQIGSTSRFKGVTWHRKVGKWQSVITVGGDPRYLGLFANEEDAALAYDAAATAAYGEYAYLNFPAALQAVSP